MKSSARCTDANGTGSSLSGPEKDVLRMLARAAATALAVGRDAWEFAVERYALREAGLDHSSLRRLLCEGLVVAGEETTRPRQRRRTFRRSANLRLTKRTCFVLAPCGEAVLRALEGSQDKPGEPSEIPAGVRLDGAHPAARPHWDRERRVLTWAGRVVKRYRVPAPNQERLLDAFEEEGWPPHLDDPLSRGNGCDSKQRLHDTIKRLNLRQTERLLQFWGDGTGTGVCWEPLLRDLPQISPRSAPDRTLTRHC